MSGTRGGRPWERWSTTWGKEGAECWGVTPPWKRVKGGLRWRRGLLASTGHVSILCGTNRFYLWLWIRRHGDRSPLGPKQSEAIFSVHLNRQDGSGGTELLGPYSPFFPGWSSPSAKSPMLGADVKKPNCHVFFKCARWWQMLRPSFLFLFFLEGRGVEGGGEGG
jgi:hypothetical protein